MEKSLSSLPKFLGALVGSATSPTKAPVGVSRGFEIFIQNVNRNASKYDLDQIVKREIQTVEQKIGQPYVAVADMRDLLCRVIYCGMLGYDVSFAYIHAVKLAQLGTGIEKRTGYLACCQLLHENHQLILLLINTIQRDLKSSNLLENLMALQAASNLVNTEMIPMVLPLVQDKLKHTRSLVRQKAVMCLYKFTVRAPDLTGHIQPTFEKALCDTDLAVVSCAVHVLSHNILKDPESHKHTGNILINILQQIITRRLSSMYEYHSVPFPWLQIQLLRCLGRLGAVDEELRVRLHAVLTEVLQRASSKENIVFAILYECILTITAIKPERSLLDEASKHVGRFLHSSVSNFKYIGVKALTTLVEISPQFANDYQSLVVDALEDADIAIQRKMLRLLHQMANQHNVQVVCTKLLEQLHSSTDKYWKSQVVTMVIDLADRLKVSVQWRWETHFSVFQQGHDCIKQQMVEGLISRINSGFLGDEGVQQRQFLVKRSIELLHCAETTHHLVQIAAWVLGENVVLLKNLPEDRVISLVIKPLLDTSAPCHTKACMITCLTKLLQAGVVKTAGLPSVLDDVMKVKQSPLIEQRLTLLRKLTNMNVDMTRLHNHGDMDFTLSFLDDFVSGHLERGLAPYRPRNIKQHDMGVRDFLHVENLQWGDKSSQTSSVTSPGRDRTNSSASLGGASKVEVHEIGLNLTEVKRVWGRLGLTDSNGSEVSQSGLQNSSSGSSQVPEQTEEEKKREDLKLALFGSQTAEQPMFDRLTRGKDSVNASDSGISSQISTVRPETLPSLDVGGWKHFHNTQISENSVARSERDFGGEQSSGEKGGSLYTEGVGPPSLLSEKISPKSDCNLLKGNDKDSILSTTNFHVSKMENVPVILQKQIPSCVRSELSGKDQSSKFTGMTTERTGDQSGQTSGQAVDQETDERDRALSELLGSRAKGSNPNSTDPLQQFSNIYDSAGLPLDASNPTVLNTLYTGHDRTSNSYGGRDVSWSQKQEQIPSSSLYDDVRGPEDALHGSTEASVMQSRDTSQSVSRTMYGDLEGSDLSFSSQEKALYNQEDILSEETISCIDSGSLYTDTKLNKLEVQMGNQDFENDQLSMLNKFESTSENTPTEMQAKSLYDESDES